MPFALVQAAIAAPVVSSFFGQKWANSILIMQLLSIGLALDAVSWIAGTLLAARGEFEIGLRYVSVQAPIFFDLVGIGAVLDQAFGTACAVGAFYAITQPLFVYGVYRKVGISVRETASLYFTPMTYAIVSVGTRLALSMLPAFGTHPLARVAIICVAAGAAYALLVRWMAPDVWQELISRLNGAIERRVIA